MNDIVNNIINTRESLKSIMNEWLDASIMDNINISENEQGSFNIIPDDAHDIKKYKAILNVLNCLVKLSNSPSPLQMITLSFEMVKNIQQFDLNNLDEFKSYLSELFANNPGLEKLFNQVLETVQKYLSQDTAQSKDVALDVQVEVLGKTQGIRDVVSALKNIQETGLVFDNDSIFATSASDIANITNQHFLNMTKGNSAALTPPEKFEFSTDKTGKYLIHETDSDLIKNFKKSINILKSIKDMLAEERRINKFSNAILTAKLLGEAGKALLVYRKLNLQREAGEYAGALSYHIKEGLLSIAPMLQDLNATIAVFEVKQRLKPGKLLGLMEPILTEYQQALINLGVEVEEINYHFQSAKKEQLQTYQNALETDLNNKNHQLEMITTVIKSLEDANKQGMEALAADKILYMYENLNYLDLPTELKKQYQDELIDTVKQRTKYLTAILTISQTAGLAMLPITQLRFLDDNIVLTNLNADDINAYRAKLQEIVTHRSIQLNADYQEMINAEKYNFENKSNDQLQFLLDNITLIDVSKEKQNTCKTAIEFNLKKRDEKNNSWSSYFYQKLVDIGSTSLNMTKTATDAIIYLTGASVLNKVYQHAQSKLQQETGYITGLAQRSEMVNRHLKMLESLPVPPVKVKPTPTNEVNSPKIEIEKMEQVSFKPETTSAPANVSSSYTQLANNISDQLVAARDSLTNNLQNWLDPSLVQDLEIARNGYEYGFLDTDSKVLKNYKVLLNIINCITELSKNFSFSQLLSLVKNTRELKLDNIGNLPESISIKDQFKLFLNISPSMAEAYQESISTIITSFQGMSMFSNDANNANMSKDSNNQGMMQSIQASLIYLKDLAEHKSNGLNPAPDASKDSAAQDALKEDDTVLENVVTELPEEAVTSNMNATANVSIFDALSVTNDEIIKLIKTTISKESQSKFTKNREGFYHADKTDTESDKNTKIILNSLKSFNALLIQARNTAQNPYSLQNLSTLLNILGEVSRICQQTKNFNNAEMNRVIASQLLSSMEHALRVANKGVKTLLCTMDTIEVNYGLKPAILLTNILPVVEHYQTACQEFNMQFDNDDQFPYVSARIKSLQDYQIKLNSELHKHEDQKEIIVQVVSILNKLQSSQIENIDCNDLVFLNKHFDELKLDIETSTAFKTNLQTVIAKRTVAMNDILTLATKSGMMFLSISNEQLKFIRDNIDLIPISEEQRNVLKSSMVAEIHDRLERGTFDNGAPEETTSWLSIYQLANTAKSKVTSGFNALKNVGEVAANIMGVTVHAKVLAQVNQQKTEVEEQIQGIIIKQNITTKRMNTLEKEKHLEERKRKTKMLQLSLSNKEKDKSRKINQQMKEGVSILKDNAKKLDKSIAKDASNDLAKEKKADEIVNSLKNYCAQQLGKLIIMADRQQTTIAVKYNKFDQLRPLELTGLNKLKFNLSKRSRKRADTKLKSTLNSINLYLKLQETLNDDNANSTEKLTYLSELCKSPLTRSQLKMDNTFVMMTKAIAYYFAKVVTFGKANLFQQSQSHRKLNKKLKNDFILAKKLDII